MRHLALLFMLASALLFIACEDEGNGAGGNATATDFKLNIKMQYGDAPLVMYDALTYPDGRTFRITDVKGYVSEIGLIKDGATTEIKDVAYFSLGDAHSDMEEAEEGFTYNFTNTGLTDFDALTFNIGLTDAQNNSKPADYDSSNDLSKASEYWSNWESYIYFKIEGNMDFDGDGNYANGENVVLHLGTENAFRNTVHEVQGNELNLKLDLEQVFVRDGVIYDMEAMPTIHASLSEAALNSINELSDNLSQAFFQ